jgi:hypothetical protein
VGTVITEMHLAIRHYDVTSGVLGFAFWFCVVQPQARVESRFVCVAVVLPDGLSFAFYLAASVILGVDRKPVAALAALAPQVHGNRFAGEFIFVRYQFSSLLLLETSAYKPHLFSFRRPWLLDQTSIDPLLMPLTRADVCVR